MQIMTKNKTAAEVVPEILEIYGASLLAGDPDRWITNWTEDCVQMPPGGPMNIGKQMLYESISAWLDAYTVSDLKMIGDMEIQEIGDWAYSRVSASYKVAPKDGSLPYVYEVKALTIYQRQPDGVWKIHRDCFNSNTPDH
jgi:ketosteroid isomerase-like protein